VSTDLVTENNNIKTVQWFELMAYMGGMWFLISKLMSMSNKLMSTNAKTLSFEIEKMQTTTNCKKVSSSDLEGGEKEKLSKK